MNSHLDKTCKCNALAEDSTKEEIFQYALLHMKVEPMEPSDLMEAEEDESHFGKTCKCNAPVADSTKEEIIQYAILHMKVEPMEAEEDESIYVNDE